MESLVLIGSNYSSLFRKADQAGTVTKVSGNNSFFNAPNDQESTDKTALASRNASLLSEFNRTVYSSEVLDLTDSPYRELIIHSLQLEDVVLRYFGLEFCWDADRDTPAGMHYPNDEYKRFLSHSALRLVVDKISMAIFQREVRKDHSKGNTEGFRDAEKLHEFPLTSSFSIGIDLNAKRARLNLLSNPAANRHMVNGKPEGDMPVARAVISDSECSEAIIPAGMCQCVLTKLSGFGTPKFLSTAALLDCTAIILHDRRNKIATLTHYWTQTITKEIIEKQLGLMIDRGASLSFIDAKVVGSTRGNLWSDSGYFNCIEPALNSLNIPITETNVGQNRPQNILFNVETGRLYQLQSRSFDRLDQVSVQNEATALKLDWTREHQYYFSDHDNTELFVFADISLSENA